MNPLDRQLTTWESADDLTYPAEAPVDVGEYCGIILFVGAETQSGKK